MTELVIGVGLDGWGSHPAASAAVGRSAGEAATGQALRQGVRGLEDGGVDLVVLADAATSSDPSAPRLDPVEAASFAAAVTERIALVASASPTHAEPFHLANQLASLDWASRGRAGWRVDVDPSLRRARAFGQDRAPAPQVARREAAEVVDAVRRVWDSWADGVLIADRASGRFLDSDRLHHVNVHGEFVSVRGPALLPRPPQGQLVVFGDPDEVADPSLEVALVSAPREAALLAPPTGATPRRFAELEVVLDTDVASGADRLSELDAQQAWRPTGRLRFAGSATELTGLLHRLSALFDGVLLHPAVGPVDTDVLVRSVLPALRPAPPTGTLRERLGLPRPSSRYTTDREAVREGAPA